MKKHTADGGCTSLRANCLKTDAESLCEKLLESGVKKIGRAHV